MVCGDEEEERECGGGCASCGQLCAGQMQSWGMWAEGDEVVRDHLNYMSNEVLDLCASR